jgi:hypothetical protein
MSGPLWQSSNPMIDLLLFIGGGMLTAFLGILGGHVATDRTPYRWMFYLGGIALAGIILITGIRNYQSALRAQTPEQIVMKAVGDANQHTDTAVDGANKHTDAQVAMVRDDLKGATAHSDQQISMVRGDLKGAIGTLTELFSKTETDLNASIGKVGKPDPPVPSQLEFSLWSDDLKSPSPLLATSLRPNKDGIFTVDFSAFNRSKTAAHSVDIWIDLCDDGCVFAKEPSGFDRPVGMREQTRHMMVVLLNPAAALPKQTVEIKLLKSYTSFEMGFRYSCEVCGNVLPTQKASVLVLPPLP